MRDVIVMWRYTKMVVLVALSGAAYFAILVPLKFATIVPGFTEIRPASGIPVVCGLLFGPAAAWGSAFGNLVGDVFGGTLTPGSIPGFIGNFLVAYVTYRMWRVLRGDRHADGSPGQLGWMALCSVAGGLVCAVVIAFGVAAMGLVPYQLLALIIVANNCVIGTIVAAILLPILYPLARSFGLLYQDILAPEDYTAGRVGWAGMVLTWAGAGLGLLAAVYARAAVPLAADLAESWGKSLLDPQVMVAGIATLAVLIGAALMSPLGGHARVADAPDAAQAPEA